MACWESRVLQTLRYRSEFAKDVHHSVLNDVPAGIRELPILNSFKKQLKTYLKD